MLGVTRFAQDRWIRTLRAVLLSMAIGAVGLAVGQSPVPAQAPAAAAWPRDSVK
jgi:hypothetical protein